MALWFKLSYAHRLFSWLVAYSLLLVGCFLLYQNQRETDFKAAELNSQLQLINLYISNELASGKVIESIDLDELRPFDDIRISVIDSTGYVTYDNSIDQLPGSNHLNRKEIAEAIKHGSGYSLRRHSESTGDTYFYSATRNSEGAIVRTAVPYSHSLSQILSADHTFIWIMGCVTLAFCIFGFFATRRVGLHISRLNSFAAGAERGDRITNTSPFPHDELGDISNHIVRLYARLQKAISDRDREHSLAMQQQQEKERIKKQLTNNINHELKTPVASIQACLETLLTYENMAPEKRREFICRSLDNTERLKKLLHDVALITRLDDGGAMISRETFDLSQVIQEVINDKAAIAHNKNIDIKNKISRSIILSGNAEMMASVFHNLIENALAYSGCSTIMVQDLLIGNQATIIFSDNGHGVSEEHLSKLFERFYRVDKGRSRALGGTGLGLAIVKNVINFHRGSITAGNQPAGGLRFTIVLPLD